MAAFSFTTLKEKELGSTFLKLPQIQEVRRRGENLPEVEAATITTLGVAEGRETIRMTTFKWGIPMI
jgi:hypothetical protein